MQLIPSKSSTSDPKVLIGYGHVGVYTEFSADGKVLCDHRLSARKYWSQGPVQNYLAYKSPWVGRPSLPPSVVLGGDNSLYVSWNGATEVRKWKVQALRDEKWTDIGTTEKTTFETEVTFDDAIGDDARLRVIALDGEGHVLGQSAEIDLQSKVVGQIQDTWGNTRC